MCMKYNLEVLRNMIREVTTNRARILQHDSLSQQHDSNRSSWAEGYDPLQKIVVLFWLKIGTKVALVAKLILGTPDHYGSTFAPGVYDS